MTRILSHIALLLLISCLIVIGGTAHAQFTIPGAGTSVSLTTAPEYPGPEQSVRLSVQSALSDLSTSEITWYANGGVIAQGVGVVQTSVTTDLLGTATDIRVEVRGVVNASATGTLRPTEVDLLWEADSYVPPFYRGRALPSAGSSVRLFAIPRLRNPGAAFMSPDELFYTWKKNNKIIAPLGGKGKHSVRIEGPVLFGSDIISVEVRTANGNLRGFAGVRIASVEPSLVLYENHPVFGILYHDALNTEDSTPDVETTLSAVPYFAPTESADDGLLQYAWRVNNFSVENDPQFPSTITLNAEGSTGRAFIELALTHATNFFLSVRNAWSLTLAGSGGATSDPFRSPGQ